MDLSVCRGCLATDVGLFSLNNEHLLATYEHIIGSTSNYNVMPDTVCTSCCEFLKQCATFITTCRKTERILIDAMLQKAVSPKTYIQNLHSISTNALTTNATLYTNQQDDERNISSIKTETVLEDVNKTENVHEEFVSIGIKEEINEVDQIDNGTDTDTTEDLADGKEADELLSDFTDLIILNKDEQKAEMEARKLTPNYMHSTNRCDLCYKGFVSEDTHRKHMKYHDESAGPHKCPICNIRRQTRRLLRSHRVIHSKRYRCKLCAHMAISSDAAKKHVRWHQGVVYKCEFCDATFSKKTTHYTHLRLQHPTSASCDLCGQSFLGQRGLDLHRKRAHEGKQESKAHECSECRLGFRSAVALGMHRDTGCDTNACPCVYCGVSFPKQTELRKHLNTHELKENPLKCSQCSAVFTSRSGRRGHAARAHRDTTCPARPRSTHTICELCGQSCKNETQLKVHHRIHTGEKPFPCALCPKTFRTKELLILHRRTHSGERPFKCSECDKAFRDKAAVNRHERTHKDIRPHPCPNCEKAFKDKGALDRHERTHTGFRPHTCPHCGKSFSQSNSLKLHVRTVHLKLPSPYKKQKHVAN